VLQYAGLSDARGLPLARPTDAGALVQETVSSFAPLFDAAGITPAVTIEPDLPAILADEGAIRRAVHNLLANALKHGAGGRSVDVSARRTISGGRPEVAIAVADRGRGIEAAELTHIFEAFYRGRHALEQQVQGNGLGLSLVKRIAEAHGGRVTVQSAPGQGATFTLCLPPAPADVVVEPAGTPAADAGSSSTSSSWKPAV
jgi:signal transduction histidine kinase